MNLPAVSDHALVRYLERVQGIDMEFMRQQVAQTCAGLSMCSAVQIKGFRYIIRDGVVITVKPIKSIRNQRVVASRNKHGQGNEPE